jgi:hypothetical protein
MRPEDRSAGSGVNQDARMSRTGPLGQARGEVALEICKSNRINGLTLFFSLVPH